MALAIFDTVLPAPLPTASAAAGKGQGDRIAAAVHSAIIAVAPRPPAIERRRETRHLYPYPIHLTPLGPDGAPVADTTLVVIGKHLAPHGVDFYSRQPLPDRRVIASFTCGRGDWVGLVLELGWCRFGRHGWYENGGRFLGVIRSPLAGLDQEA